MGRLAFVLKNKLFLDKKISWPAIFISSAQSLMFSLALAFVFACCMRVRGATQALGLEGMEPVPPPVRSRPKRGNNRPGDAGLDSNGRGRVSARGVRRKERSSGYLGEERGNSRSGAGYRGQSRKDRSNGSGRGRAGGGRVR